MTEFQRDKCFTFFKSFADQLDKIARLMGKEMAFDCCQAIYNYALYSEKPKDETVDMLITSMYETIDYSQDRRADGFKGGRPREHDHEEIISKRREGKTLRETARETGASRSTVKRALKRHDNDNEYDSDTEYDNDVDNASESDPEKENNYEASCEYNYDNAYDDDTDSDTEYDADLDNASEYESEKEDEYEYNNNALLMDPYAPPYEPMQLNDLQHGEVIFSAAVKNIQRRNCT